MALAGDSGHLSLLCSLAQMVPPGTPVVLRPYAPHTRAWRAEGRQSR